MTKHFLHNAMRQFLTLPAVGQLPTLVYDGSMLDHAATGAYLNQFARTASLSNPNINYSAVTNASTTALALTPANCANGIINAILLASGGSANTNTTDTATQIINLYWPGVQVGSTALLLIGNLNSGTMTLAGGTGVTISGTATQVTTTLGYWVVKCTNLANPTLPGSVATNTTTTSAAVAANSTQANPTSVIPVAASTGISTVAGASWLGVVNTDGSTSYYNVLSVSSLNITVAGPLTKAIASGAAVSVFNNAISITRMFVVTTVAA